MDTVTGVKKLSPRGVIGVFAGLRVAVGIGVGLSLFPAPVGELMGQDQSETLMTGYFAVRETVLGLGGFFTALAGSPDAIRTWAALGALTDAGDLATSLKEFRNGGERGVLVQALLAVAGLVAESRAFSRSLGRTA